jgi:predicted NUDIX family phosphoesterase
MILKQKVKHSEFTFGIHHQGLTDLVPSAGFSLLGNTQTVEVLKGLEEYVMGARRSLIGKLCLLRQAIAYTLGYQVFHGPEGAYVRFFLYRRNKKNGEGRMSGMLSMGAGGHVEYLDFQPHLLCADEPRTPDSELLDTGAMDLMETLDESMLREWSEEVHLFSAKMSAVNISEAVAGVNVAQGLQRLGFVWDGVPEEQPNYVGSSHFGVVYALEIPTDTETFDMAEEMNDALGWFGLADIEEAGGIDAFVKQHTEDGDFEPWTRFIVERLADVQTHLLETYHKTA